MTMRSALPRFTAGLVSAFSTLALVLAGVGIFGVTAYAVSQRTREFGIRLALGAQRTHVGAIVMRRVGVLAVLRDRDRIGARLRPRQPDVRPALRRDAGRSGHVLGGARHDRVDRACRDRGAVVSGGAGQSGHHPQGGIVTRHRQRVRYRPAPLIFAALVASGRGPAGLSGGAVKAPGKQEREIVAMRAAPPGSHELRIAPFPQPLVMAIDVHRIGVPRFRRITPRARRGEQHRPGERRAAGRRAHAASARGSSRLPRRAAPAAAGDRSDSAGRRCSRPTTRCIRHTARTARSPPASTRAACRATLRSTRAAATAA